MPNHMYQPVALRGIDDKAKVSLNRSTEDG
jgi:hypothetical protein